MPNEHTKVSIARSGKSTRVFLDGTEVHNVTELRTAQKADLRGVVDVSITFIAYEVRRTTEDHPAQPSPNPREMVVVRWVGAPHGTPEIYRSREVDYGDMLRDACLRWMRREDAERLIAAHGEHCEALEVWRAAREVTTIQRTPGREVFHHARSTPTITIEPYEATE